MTEQRTPDEKLDQCWSIDECDFSHATLGDLLDCNDEIEAGAVVYVGTPVRNAPSMFVDDADNIIERMNERAYDEHGECAEDFPDDVTKEAKDELTAFLIAWADKHCEARFYSVDNIREHTITAEDLA